MAKQTYRIVVPTNTVAYATLIKNIDKKNDDLGDTSPLKGSTAEIKQAVEDMEKASVLDAKATALKDEAETLILQRNILQNKQTLPNERGWRKILEGANMKNIQEMGAFGYTIDRSQKQPKPPKA